MKRGKTSDGQVPGDCRGDWPLPAARKDRRSQGSDADSGMKARDGRRLWDRPPPVALGCQPNRKAAPAGRGERTRARGTRRDWGARPANRRADRRRGSCGSLARRRRIAGHQSFERQPRAWVQVQFAGFEPRNGRLVHAQHFTEFGLRGCELLTDCADIKHARGICT